MTDVTPTANLTPAIRNLFEKLEIESTMLDDSPVSAYSIAEKILSADTEEAIFEAANAGTTAGKNYVNRPFRLHENNISVRESNRDDLDGGLIDPRTGKQFYVLLSVTDLETGNDDVLNCGSPSIVTTLLALRDGGHMAKYNDEGGMPLMITSKPTGNGEVLILKPFRAANAAKKTARK